MKTSLPKYSGAFVAKIAFITVGILSAAQSQAVVISGTSNAGSNGLGVGPITLAVGFTMPGQDYTLTNVVLGLGFYSGPNDAVISIYSDSSGFPGSALATLVDPAIGASPADYTFTPPAGPPTTLFANTSYWLVLAPETGNYSWITAMGGPMGVATFEGYAQNAGSGWISLLPPGDHLRFTINGEPVTPSVPETGSTVMLLGIGLLTLAFLSTRQWTCSS